MSTAEDLSAIEPVEVGDESELRQRIIDRRHSIEESYWAMAIDLHKVWDNQLFIEWGFDSWQIYVEEELDYKIRTAQYFISIADWFGKMSKPVQEWIKSIGWTKAKTLVGKVDESNWKEWRKKVKGKSVAQIADMLKSGSASKADGDSDKPKRKTFALFADQLENVERAVKKAKEEAKSDKDGHAIDLICTEYLATHAGELALSDYLDRIEKNFGIKLIAYNETEEEIVYGEKTLDSLVEEGDEE